MPAQDAAHVGEAGNDSGHGIFAADLVFQVDEALVFGGDECLEDFGDGNDTFADGDLAFLCGEVGEVFGVEVEEARADGVDRFDDIGTGADAVADVDAAADAGVHVADDLEDVEGRVPDGVFGAVVVDSEAGCRTA